MSASMFDKRRLAMPTTLQFHVPNHSDGIILNKQTTRTFTRDAQASYDAGSVMRFKLQDQKALDFKSVALNFQIKTNDARASIDDWAGSIFRTISWAFNGSQVERIDYYNRVHNALASFTVDDGYRQSIWGEMEGYYAKIHGVYGDLGLHSSTLNQFVINEQNNVLTFEVFDNGLKMIRDIILTPISGDGDAVADSIQSDIRGTIATGKLGTNATCAFTNNAFVITIYGADGWTNLQSGRVVVPSDPNKARDASSSLGFLTGGSLINVNANDVTITAQIQSEYRPAYEPISDTAFPDVKLGEQYGGFLNASWKLRKYSGEQGSLDHSVARQYTVHFDLSGIFARYDKLAWLPLFNSVDIEILLEQAHLVMNQWGVDVKDSKKTYTVLYPEIQAEMYTLSQEYVNALSASMQEAGLTVAFDTYQTFYNSIVTGKNHNVVINTRLSSLKSMYIFFYQEHGTQGAEGKRLEKTWIQQRRIVTEDQKDVAKLEEYQMFIDGRPVQAHRIKTSDSSHSEAIWELMKSFRMHGDVTATPHVSREEYTNRCFSPSVGKGDNVPNDIYKMYDEQHFMIAVDLEKSDLLSGHSVANQIWIELQWDKAIGNGVQMFTVLHYDKNVVVFPGLIFEERV